jgi:multiple sugar transport system ATP-binding protein
MVVAGARPLRRPPAAGLFEPQPLVLGVRPEHLQLVEPARAHVRGQVIVTERLGSETLVHADTAGGPAVVRVEGDSRLRAGDAVGLQVPAGRAHLFAADGLRLPLGAAA